MGTSLSGLTPATTFDGLLKTSDNDAIGTGLKTISDGSGNDSVLQLSDSELKVGGQFNVDTDGDLTSFNLRGNGLNINQIYHANETTYNTIAMANSAGISMKNGTGTALLARGGNVGIGGITATPTARLQVNGSGATSATTSLLVQNSAGADYLKVTDDGNVQLGSSINVQSTGISAYNSIQLKTFIGGGVYESGLVLTGNGAPSKVGIGETTPTARLHIKGSGNDNTTTSLLVQNSDGANAFRITDNKIGHFFSHLNIDGQNYVAGNLSAGSSSVPSGTRAYIKGSGATSATTALLVQNSAGSELFNLTDDGSINMSAFRQIRGGSSSYSITLQGTTAMQFTSWAKDFVWTTQNGTIATLKNDGKLGLGENTPTAKLHVKGSGNDATTTALLVQNSDGAELLKVLDTGNITIDDRLGIGVDYVRDLNRIQTAALSIGSNTFYAASGTQVHIKGSGATSATTALLVQNSAGTEAFKIQDDRKAVFSGLTQFGNNVQFLGANDTSSLNNMRFVVPGSAKSLTINKDYNLTNDASAIVDIQSTTQGFLPPRMTTTERDAITSPASGLMVYNTTTNKAQCYNGTTWNDLF